ncbi:MAG TPA: diguanylate cyclase [Acidobacteriaceae bacterium]|nr:diguanylate cyclase [Acidobacteriaceae bacterium]
MKRLLSLFVLILGSSTALRASSPAPLTSLSAVHALTNAEASRHLPADFDATVTYFRAYEKTLFVQDGDAGIYVYSLADIRLQPGDRIRVRGTTQESFRPYVLADSITRLGQRTLPPPVHATFDDLIHARYDCRLATIRAQVRTADLLNASTRNAYLQMQTDGGEIDAVLDTDDLRALRALLDAEVEVTGVASGRFDGKMQQTGVLLHVASLDGLRILHRASASPWSLPPTPMDAILTRYHVNDLTPRVRVEGTVTYYQPGSGLVLQQGTRSLWIATVTRDDLPIGEVVDATGIPAVQGGFLTLTHGEFRDRHIRAPLLPRAVQWDDLTRSRYIFDLISVQGRVIMQVREETQDQYVLWSEGRLFSAVLRHPAGTVFAVSAPPLPSMKNLPLGSTVEIVGICAVGDSNPFDPQVPFNLLMRTPSDIVILARPSPLNVRNLVILVGFLLLVVIAVGLRGWHIEHRVRHQTAALANIERRRGRILEDINGTRPVEEILHSITELLSSHLEGAPCWCRLADGSAIGHPPSPQPPLRIVENQIRPSSGPSPGSLFVAFDPLAKPLSTEAEALSMTTELAALAIETRRVRSDLLRRSEYDLLTDMHNRFSLNTHFDSLIEEARLQDRLFGLIYIDLDGFKQINDVYGHQIGDRYLQEAAKRMKRQLRPDDWLARVGGDEFAVLVHQAGCRADVQEIALRIERCFDHPFSIAGCLLRASASWGIALYPEDGATRDQLLTSADSAMYEVKNARRPAARSQPDPQLPAKILRSS